MLKNPHEKDLTLMARKIMDSAGQHQKSESENSFKRVGATIPYTLAEIFDRADQAGNPPPQIAIDALVDILAKEAFDPRFDLAEGMEVVLLILQAVAKMVARKTLESARMEGLSWRESVILAKSVADAYAAGDFKKIARSLQ